MTGSCSAHHSLGHHPRPKLSGQSSAKPVSQPVTARSTPGGHMATNTPTRHRSAKSARAWVLALTGIGSLMVAPDTPVVSTAPCTIRVAPHASIEELEGTVNAHHVT